MCELRTVTSAAKHFKKIQIFPLFFNSVFTFYVEGSPPALRFLQVVTLFCLPAVSRGHHETGWCTAGLVLERRGPAGALLGPCNVASGYCCLTIIIPFWTLLELHVFFNPSQNDLKYCHAILWIIYYFSVDCCLFLDLIAFSFIPRRLLLWKIHIRMMSVMIFFAIDFPAFSPIIINFK